MTGRAEKKNKIAGVEKLLVRRGQRLHQLNALNTVAWVNILNVD